MTVRWWRRNWWALAAVLPLLLAVVLVGPDDPYRRWQTAQPREAVAPGPDGWVDYAGIRLRLIRLTPTDLREPVLGDPYPMPDGVTAWLALVSFTAPADPDELIGCEFELEDASGRRFGASPSILEGAEPADGTPRSPAAGCSPSTARETPDGGYLTALLFALPAPASPVALRLTSFEELPRYVRWEVSEGGGTG